MSWEEREILLVVKTYPERSRKYGNTVCTAGILEDTEELVRIYPIKYEVYKNKNLTKFVRFTAEIKTDTSDYLKRKESHKIKDSTIKIVDESLIDPSKKWVWDKRKNIISKYVSNSIESLKEEFENDRTSLGIIKPMEETINFKFKKPVDEVEIDIAKEVQMTLDGGKIRMVDEIEKIFYYNFKCHGVNCNGHNMICEDWELLEAFRKWKEIYKRPKTLKDKLKQRFLFEMIYKRELHFILGTHWKFPTWMIVGLFYPSKDAHQNYITEYT